MTHPLSEMLRQSAIQARALDRGPLLVAAAEELDRLHALVENADTQANALENAKLREQLLNLSSRTAEYEPVLRLIAIGPRADGTYNYCREACQQLAIKALGYE